MIKKIEYKFAIGRNSDSVLLKQISNGLNAVAAVDTSRLNGSIYNITKTGVVNYNRQIKIIKEIPIYDLFFMPNYFCFSILSLILSLKASFLSFLFFFKAKRYSRRIIFTSSVISLCKSAAEIVL